MTVRFTIGHVGGGTKRVEVPPEAVDAELVSFVEELYGADDEHYQGYVLNSAGAGMTLFDGGLMAWDANVGAAESASRYYRPASLAEAVEVLNAFVNLRQEGFAGRFGPDIPPTGPGLNFLLASMGQFALHQAAWAGNFERVKALVEAGHDVNQRVPEGTTPLMGAVREGLSEVCRFLVEHGADVTVRLPSDGWDTDDWSLLRLAREQGHAEVAQLLEQAGAPE